MRSLRCVNSDRLLDNQLVDAINSDKDHFSQIEREGESKGYDSLDNIFCLFPIILVYESFIIID